MTILKKNRNTKTYKMIKIQTIIHPLAREVKDTLLTRKRQLTADSDSNSLLGVLLVCHKAK